MMGTVWLRLNSDESNIQPRVRALSFDCVYEIADSVEDQRALLRLGVYVFHGRRVRARVSRGPGDICQGARERPVRRGQLHAGQLCDRRPVSLCVRARALSPP
jgi:hypothetical protein